MLALPCLLLSLFFVSALGGVTLHDDCDLWASQNECVNNPNFMWSSCSSACLQQKDDNAPDCKKWAEEEFQCWENPAYIQLHCPQSCGYQLHWNPYIRNEMEFDHLAPPDGAEGEIITSRLSSLLSCPVEDMMQVGDAVRHRVHAYLSGGANLKMTLGLASSAPTPFLGAYGLVEAVLYSLRVYNLIVSGSAHEAATEALRDASASRLEKVLAALADSGWKADPLFRQLPQFGQYLVEASIDAKAALGLDGQAEEVGPAGTCSASGEPRPPVQALGAHLQLLDAKAKLKASVWTAGALVKPPTVALKGEGPVVTMPLLGLGTWQLSGDECEEAVYTAIRLGYRHIDSAEAYGNEASVGRAVRRALSDGLASRAELFIATKVSDEASAKNMRAHVLRQLASLGVDYVDLYYLHSPMDDNVMAKAWAALEALVSEGKIRALAVSNFDQPSLSFFSSPSSRVQPAVLQNKFDLYHHGKQLDNVGEDIYYHARERGLLLLAYSPFSSYPFSMMPALDPVVQAVAQRLPPLSLESAEAYLPPSAHADLHALYANSVPVTPAMVLLRWTLDLGLAAIPRSTSSRRLLDNLLAGALPPLSSEDMALLSSLHFLTSSPLCVAV